MQSTKPAFRRHVPAWIEKILRYRPRVACLMGLGDLLGAVEEVFHKWEGTKCRPIGAYTQEPVSLNWILRLWKIVHPPDDCGEEAVTYIAVVSFNVSLSSAVVATAHADWPWFID